MPAFSLSAVVPTPGDPIRPEDYIELVINTADTGVETIAGVIVGVEFPGLGVEEVAFDAAFVGPVDVLPFKSAYVGSRWATYPATPPSSAVHLTLRRAPSWPDAPKVWVYVFGTAGTRLAVALAWAVPALPPLPPLVVPPVSPIVAGGAVECAPTIFDQAYFLRVLERAYPEDYFRALERNPAGGFELFQALAKVGERVSLAISRFECCSYLMTAHGGAKATGIAEFYRDSISGAPGIYTLQVGSQVSTDDGRVFVTTAPVLIGSGLGPWAAPIASIACGYEYNVPGFLVRPSGEVLPGAISEIAKFVADDPTVWDGRLAVRNPLPTAGGVFPCLDLVGEDRGIPRYPREPDDVYKMRITTTPDTVSPAAILRGLVRILAPPPLRYTAPFFREVGRLDLLGAPGLPGLFYDAGSSADTPQVPAHNFAYDMDPIVRPLDTWKVWLDHVEMRAFFVVGMPVVPLGYFGAFYDGDSLDFAPDPSAFDTTSVDVYPLTCFWDGYAAIGTAYNQAVWQMLVDKHAAGVGFDLYQI